MNSPGLSWHGYPTSANVSLLFTEVPYLERFAAAAAAGFTAVETWWPFPTASPSRAEVDELLDTIESAGLSLTGMNVFAGDMAGGERGIACLPERAGELDASLAALRSIAERTGCRGFNLLHGQVPDGAAGPDGAGGGAADAIAHEAAVRSFRRAADALADLPGSPGVVLVEPLARGLNGAYPLETAADALALIDEAGSQNLALLLDTFHLARNGEDLPALIAESAERIGHVQLADAPDRGEPGSGTVDLDAVGAALQHAGYAGTVAAEYKPTGETRSTLGWLTRRAAAEPLA